MSISEAASRRGARLVRADGIDIACTEVGNGPALVLLHGGFVSTGPAWTGSPVAHVDHLATLGQHFRVIAPDTRGAGATVHPGGPATYDMLADDVRALIDALELESPTVVGFSEGGTTATVLALRHPDVVGALVNHAGFDLFDPQAPAHQMLRPMFGGSPEATAADPDAAERAFQQDPAMATMFATMKADCDDAQGAGQWRANLELFFDRNAAPLGYGLDDFSRLDLPTLILGGDHDFFCPPQLAIRAWEQLPHGELAVLPGTGHEITPAAIETIVGFGTRVAAGTGGR